MATGAYKTKLLSDHAAGRRDTRASAGHALAGALGFLRACHGRRRKHQRQHALSHVPGVTVTDNICAPYLSNFLSFFLSLSLSLNCYRLRVNKLELETLSLSLKNNTHTPSCPCTLPKWHSDALFISIALRRSATAPTPSALSAVNKSFMQMCSYVYVHFRSILHSPLRLTGNPLALYICIHTFGYAVREPTPATHRLERQ